MTISYDADLDAAPRRLDPPFALSITTAALATATSVLAPQASAVSPLIVAPLLLGSAWLARRGSLAGQLAWMGALLHVACTHALPVLSTSASSQIPAHVAVVALSLYALLDLLLDVDADAVRDAFGARTPTRTVAAFLALAGVALSAAWALPIALLAGALLWRRRPWGFVLAGLLLPNATLLALSRAASGDPRAAVVAAMGAALTVGYLRSIERSAMPLPSL